MFLPSNDLTYNDSKQFCVLDIELHYKKKKGLTHFDSFDVFIALLLFISSIYIIQLTRHDTCTCNPQCKVEAFSHVPAMNNCMNIGDVCISFAIYSRNCRQWMVRYLTASVGKAVTVNDTVIVMTQPYGFSYLNCLVYLLQYKQGILNFWIWVGNINCELQ